MGISPKWIPKWLINEKMLIVTRKIHIKITVEYTPTAVAEIRNTDGSKCQRRNGAQGIFINY